MIYAGMVAVLLVLVTAFFLSPRKTIRLQKINIDMKIFQKINHEILIFNKLKITLPITRKVPDIYVKWLGRLHINPKDKIISNDPVEKLMYLCAAAKLFSVNYNLFCKRQIYTAFFTAKQLYKNILYIYGVQKRIRDTILFSIRPLKLSERGNLYITHQPRFKYMYTKFVERKENLYFSDSYTIQNKDGAEVKNFVVQVDDFFVDCYEIKGRHCFLYDTQLDKTKCTISHSGDTLYCTNRGRALAINVQGVARTNFETNIVTQDENLKVSINLENGGRICILHSDTRMNAQMLVSKTKSLPKFNYLLDQVEIEKNKVIEDLFEKANLAPFISGEKLKSRIAAAIRCVPSLYLPTLVYEITDADELFAVLDSFDNFKKIVRAGVNLNVIVMYSSQNDIVREFITAFTSKTHATELIKCGVFLFFIDRIRVDTDAVYYFSKMLDATNNSISKIRPLCEKSKELYILSRKAVSYSITNIRTGATKYHRLGPQQEIIDEFGNIIPVGYDAVCRASVRVVTVPLRRRTNASVFASSFVDKQGEFFKKRDTRVNN